MAGEEDHRRDSSPRRHVVLFSLPFQGHLNPMLKLAALLHARGLGVTVLHTDFNAPDPGRHHPELTFVPIHETLRDEATSPDSDILTKLLALNAACEAPFRDALASLLRRGQGQDDVTCAVVDGQCYAALGAAGQLGVPVLALRTDSAAALRNMLAYPRLRNAGYLPIKEEQLDEVVPGLEPLRVRDLIRVDGCDADEMCGFVARVADAVGAAASGIVFNTLEAMEAPELAKIRRELCLPAFAVGPLHLLSSRCQVSAEQEQSLYAPDPSCVSWLDARPPRSVLYVSLGSLACVGRGVFEEMAWGLAASRVPFLWVVRPGLVTGEEEVPPLLPDGFGEEIRNRGKVVAWAPQRAVLAHAAIGAFWTHCGWNSVLESVCDGVPMLVHPCFADQMVNGRYVTRVWGVGLEVGEEIERGRVAEAVRRVTMAGEDDGPLGLMREKAQRLQMRASSATSSAMDGLVQFLMTL